MLRSLFLRLGIVIPLFVSLSSSASAIDLDLRFQTPVKAGASRYHRLIRNAHWDPEKTAVIVCDMWDSHHCVNAVRRANELAPHIDQFCVTLRDQGVTIIHAPSSCMNFYKNHAARIRAQQLTPLSSYPDQISTWCDQIPSEENAAYPLDQSSGGEDDDVIEHQQWAERLAAIGRNPRTPWKRQCERILIDSAKDFISDSGKEIWNILHHRNIDNVILVGVHTNMCVLGRPFGLRRMVTAGKNVALVRDLTDTMYDYRAWPYASHFTGTDLIVQHIERYVCPTISSNQVLGGSEFRFADDRRKRLVMIVAEDEYKTEKTLPYFAAKHLSQAFSVHFVWGSEEQRHHLVGLDAIRDADAILVSVRRRALPVDDLELIREFVAQGKPVIGIRTANHAFSLRGKQPPENSAVWDSFDGDVFGGNYTNHYGNSLKAAVNVPDSSNHPILAASEASKITPGGSLYKVSPLAPGTMLLLNGSVPNQAREPIAWTFIRSDGGRSFYTSLGHRDDFEQAEFESLLSAGVHWACGLRPPLLAEIKAQNARHSSGKGKQR